LWAGKGTGLFYASDGKGRGDGLGAAQYGQSATGEPGDGTGTPSVSMAVP
jgi:hypothetical protein